MNETARNTVALALGAALVACGVMWVQEEEPDGSAGTARAQAAPVRQRAAGGAGASRSVPLGDGSTADTGEQPGRVRPARLAAGQRPPQFVVFSWDGAGEDGNGLFSHFQRVGREVGATQTFFLTGLYLLPEGQAARYRPPGHRRGDSDIDYLRDESVRRTLAQVRAAWLGGNEIGTHFNGHFCGRTGVGSWSAAQWRSEVAQAKWFVKNWRTTTGWHDLPALPFHYDRELIGGRTPCLEGQGTFLKTAKSMGFRYDSSGQGEQVWPNKRHGVWEIPLQQVPFPGRSYEVLSMDYNFLANQSKTYDGARASRPGWRWQTHQGLLRGFERAYLGNRAPMIIGNHFERWNGGIYMSAVEELMRTVCRKQEVRCVSFRQLVDWLDAQDPAVLRELRTLGVGQAPPRGWPGSTAGDRHLLTAP